jgi:hypothetical protein
MVLFAGVLGYAAGVSCYRRRFLSAVMLMGLALLALSTVGLFFPLGWWFR